MKDVPENELLSAYLDGELTAEEQAEVEKLLATSPAARQLVDELRTLSSSLQALPTYQIGEDLSQQVFRLAEQGKLDPRAAPGGPKAEIEQPKGPVWRAMVRRFTRPRSLVWAGAAVAAALLLMVMQWDRLFEPGSREIAMDTGAKEAPAAAPPAAATTEAGEAADAERVADYPAEEELAARAMKRGREDLVVGKAGLRDAMSAPVPAAAAPAAPPAPGTAFGSAVAEPTQAPAAVGPAEEGFGGMGVGGAPLLAKESDAVEVQRAASGRPRKDQPAIVSAKAEAGTGVMRQGPSPGKADQPPPDVQRPEPALVVSCWTTPAALRERAFERLLEEQDIRRVDTARTDAEGALVPTPLSQLGQAESYAAQAGPRGWRQVVDVEATRDQLKALLLRVQGQSDEFAFFDAVGGLGRRGVNGRQSRLALDHAHAYQKVEPAAETTAEGVQQKFGRMEVDKLLGLLERGEADEEMWRKAGIGVLADGQPPHPDSALQRERGPGYVAARRQRAQQELELKARPRGGFGVPGGGPAGPAAAPASGVARQPAAAEQVTPPSEVAAPEEPTPKLQAEAMEIQAEQSQADEKERVANESTEERGADRHVRESVGGRKQKLLTEPARQKLPGAPVPAEEPDRYARTYHVRFKFYVVDRPGGVAASVAQEAAAARMAEEPPMALDACEEPPAAAPPAAAGAPGPP